MKKVTYFDVEYANSKNKSICQLGLLCEDYGTGEPIYPERNIFVNPEDGFDDFCIRIHGITADKVKDELSFPEVWNQIEHYFTNTIIIGHNLASSDLNALVKNLRRYNIDVPELYYICTLELSRIYIPSYAVSNYSLSSLCTYFNIDIDSEHDAFDDACANSDLFKSLVNTYHINVEDHIKRYNSAENNQYIQYMSSPVLRKSISDFYGVIRGFSIDNKITSEELDYIKEWSKEKSPYSSHKEISAILEVICRIFEDGVVSNNEILKLQATIKNYLDIVTTSPITLATQILSGIMKGVIIDGTVSEDECKNLRQWLYDNIYLSGHYPFDKLIKVLEDVLMDGIVTQQESNYINTIINELLNPVECLKVQVNSVDNKHVCLSGNFAYGQKSDVEKYIQERGGIIDSTVKKTTDILLIGDYECQTYSNGTYGTKVKKAIEYNERGCNIQILKEKDFIEQVI